MADAAADAPRAQVSINTLMISTDRITMLADTVNSGRVVMEPETGQRLLTALRQHADDVERWRARSWELLRPLPMGDNWVTANMGAKLYNRVANGDQSFTQVLDHYGKAVHAAAGAVTEAIRRYEHNEHDQAATFNAIAAR
ncbi:hypothetical protein F0L68_12300 [Solihabitans fulvus]|uniref:Uncharacterized protein n=1 Tax=Solihabitans fulvus TaxID=1892852 RepID=A0A5B2XIP2_9PSEU|nr:hypothetical protein [Solihabitans fulvus]KAA2262670.1 hypothetical protein F0L68_12300 [Solihabitans fulvus]